MDFAYTELNQSQFFLEHDYGKNIKISQDILLNTLIQKLSIPDTTQPLFNIYLKKAYEILFQKVLSHQLLKENTEVKTRMFDQCPQAILKSDIISPKNKIVCVDLARAGMVPSQLLFDYLNLFVDFQNIRQDHIYVQRVTGEHNQVTGVDFNGSKIGGDIDQAYVILPDPMGATCGTISQAIDHYKKNIKGNAIKFISVHLIITPEFIKKLKSTHPDVIIYAGRIDRALSEQEILKLKPGQDIENEFGLNEIQYIVPGAGGVGEIINNSFV